jgi:Na+-translocating ferredoxin:NAD+ oxidoreductase RnfG subunit
VSFREQFVGLISGITIGDGENQIDSLSGATISSQAIVDGVNAALDCVKNLG